uniref:Uncharacterized protein n=1 Tax=Ciona intestinalis TaxID=7719 RepID=H2XKF0_CIOIN
MIWLKQLFILSTYLSGRDNLGDDLKIRMTVKLHMVYSTFGSGKL